MKYKVGDKVRVREDLVDGKRYYMNDKRQCETAVSEMVSLGGRIVEIDSVGTYYGVKGNCWNWTDEMFEPVTAQKIVITSDGKETLARLYDGGKVVKTATAKCSPDDTFDFDVGAKLAFERLMNEGKKPLTFREKLRQEHPEKLKKTYGGGCYGCPQNYGYEEEDYCPKTAKRVETCTQCWDRAIPEEKKEEYYNGKVVCVERGFGHSTPIPDITVGKVYTVTDGILVAGDNYESFKYKTLDGICRGLGHKFIPFVE